MNKCVNPPCFNWLTISYSINHIVHYCKLWANPKKRWGSHPPLLGVSPVTSQNWQLTRVFPRAALSQICTSSPFRMWSSEKERSAWGECWRESKQAIVGLKKPVKEIALLTSSTAWTKRLEVNQRGSHLLTFCTVQIRCQKLYWRVWSVFLICHFVSRHSSYSFSFLLRINIVAIYILHELVYSVRLFMKMASWGFVF